MNNIGNVHMGGRYYYVLKDAAGNIKYKSDWAPNLITNYGIVRAARGEIITQNAALGSSSTPASFTDTSLGSPLTLTSGDRATKVSVSSVTPSAPDGDVASVLNKYVFDIGESTGTVREFGLSDDYYPYTQNGIVCIRVVLPEPIVKGPDDQLTIFHEHFFKWDITARTGTLLISGEEYDYTANAFYLSNSSSYGLVGSFSTSAYRYRFSDAAGAAYPYMKGVYGNASISGDVSDRPTWISISNSGDGSPSEGATSTVTAVCNIDSMNGVGVRGIRWLSFPGRLASMGNSAGYQVSIGKVSDGSAHPKESTHEFRITVSMTLHRYTP